jgi:hypothetical protein
MPEQLKPCPHCGETEKLSCEGCDLEFPLAIYNVRCDNCGASGPDTAGCDGADHDGAKRAAAAAWNSLPRRGEEP